MARRWKKVELEIARLLGGERIPITGRTHRRGAASVPDVRHPWMAIEIKSWRNLPLTVKKALEQAERAAASEKRRDGVDRLPVAIIHEDRRNYGNSLVVLRLDDADAWFGFYQGSPARGKTGAAELQIASG